ncbi:MAG TPA: hypothetical protein VE153_10740 [Myxococcus sp.]|nr:hypothetical protein [Myxococcus sp.]
MSSFPGDDLGASMINPANIQKGMAVRDRDGEPLGTVIEVDAGGFLIDKGRLFTRDHRATFAEVMDIDRDDVYLRQDLASMPDLTAEALSRRRGAAREPLSGGLGLRPRDLEQARMDSAKFQDHGRYDVSSGARPADAVRGDVISEGEPSVVVVQQPPVVVERRAARDDEETVRRDAPADQDPTWQH